MKKIISILACVCLVLTAVVVPAFAAGTSATITFNDKAKRTEFDSNHQVWVENGITVTNNKSASISNVGDYAAPARFYKGSEVIIEYPGMTSIVIDASTVSDMKYVAWDSSFEDSNATATVNGKITTITFATAVDSFTFAETSAQCRADSITVYTGDATGGTTPTPPPATGSDPAADSTLTVKEAIDLGASKDHNVFTDGKYYIEGEITEVYNTQYGNMKVTDGNGNIITIYGTYGADGADRYDALADKPVAGDTVKLYGIIGQYNGNAQMKNAWIISFTAGSNDDNNDNNDNNNNDSNTPAGEATYEVVDAPVAGTAYKFGMVQANLADGNVYYLIGGMNGYYMATDITVDAAIDVYLEATTGGYYMYTMIAGEKTYINMVVSGTHVNGAYEAAASTVYTFDAEKKTVVATVNEDLYWFGTRNDANYTTMGPCKVSYEGFYGQFYAAVDNDDTNNGGANNDVNNNTNNDNSTQSPNTGYSVVVFAVVAVMAAAAVVVFTKKVRA